jgi:hypothetical protein
MDYRALLKKYMDHVCECEGIYFTLKAQPWDTSPDRVTEEEEAAFAELIRELDAEEDERRARKALTAAPPVAS